MDQTEAIQPKKSYSGLFGWLHWLKDWVESLARRRYAVAALFFVALIESIFFPIPVDVLLIALCVGLPRRSLYFAMICTLGSVTGAALGYALGFLAWYNVTEGGVMEFSALAMFFFNNVPGFTVEVFEQVGVLYRDHDFWAIFVAGFTPLPYKVFTVTAGVFHLSFPVFLIASFFSRAGRFFLVAALFYFFGAPIKRFIDKYLELLTVLFMILLIGGFVLLRFVF